MISKEQYEQVLKQIETSEKGIIKICRAMHIDQDRFYEYMRSVEGASEQYAQSKQKQIDVIMDTIDELHQQCLDEIRNIEDPKRCNAIQNAYKSMIQDKHWIASKLQSHKYGDKIDVTSDGQSIAPSATLIAARKRSQSQQKVSINPKSSTISDNANASII